MVGSSPLAKSPRNPLQLVSGVRYNSHTHSLNDSELLSQLVEAGHTCSRQTSNLHTDLHTQGEGGGTVQNHGDKRRPTVTSRKLSHGLSHARGPGEKSV